MPAQVVDQVVPDFLADSPVVVQRHAGQITSDAGLLPVRRFDQPWRFTERLAACPADAVPDRPRPPLSDGPPARVRHRRGPRGLQRPRPAAGRAGSQDGRRPRGRRRRPAAGRLHGGHRRRAAGGGQPGRGAGVGHARPGRGRRPDARPPAADAVPRVLRPAPVLPADHPRNDDAARIPVAAPPRHGPGVAGGRRRPDGGGRRAARKAARRRRPRPRRRRVGPAADVRRVRGERPDPHAGLLLQPSARATDRASSSDRSAYTCVAASVRWPRRA